MRGHAAAADVYIFQRTVKSQKLDRETRGQRISVNPPHEVSFIQLVQERHRDMTNMLVLEADLRTHRYIVLEEIELVQCRSHKQRSQVQQQHRLLIFRP